MKPRHTEPKDRERRGNPLLKERIHDPYKSDEKLAEPARCPDCGLVWTDGRWQRVDVEPAAARETPCPACRRVRDRYPAGEVIIAGAFAATHADEILGLVRNAEQAEQSEHPLNRIMGIEQRDQDLVVTTTDVHLPRRIGHALEHAWHGELTTHYDEEGYFARVTWRRDE